MLMYFQRAFMFVLENHPQIQRQIEQMMKDFVSDPEMRTRMKLPKLEIILALSTVCHSINFADILEPYIDELNDRNVYVSMKNQGDFNQITEEQTSDQYFRTTYNTVKTSYHLLMFFQFFNNFVINKDSNDRHFEALINEYDKRYSRLFHKIEDAIQIKIKAIQGIASFPNAYEMLGLNVPNMNELNRIMRDAIKRSETKNYHMGAELALQIPTLLNSINEILQNRISVFSLINPENSQELLPSDNPQWLSSLEKRFPWTREFMLKSNSDYTPARIAYESDRRNTGSDSTDVFVSHYQNQVWWSRQRSMEADSVVQAYDGFTWRELFIKLDLEEVI